MESSESLRRPRRSVASVPGSGGTHAAATLVLAALVLSLLAVLPMAAQEMIPSTAQRADLDGLQAGSLSKMQAERLRQSLQLTPATRDSNAEQGESNEPVLPEPSEPTAERGPSMTERLIAGQTEAEVSTELQQFGYEVFARSVSTFAPVTNVPVGPDYVVGPGDSFTITMWGRLDAQYSLQVDRSGQVVIPEVGALKVWGMKFSQMQDYLQNELSRKYTDFKMTVVMDRLRTIRVFVVGEATAPSSYSVSSLSTIINALVAAGGPSKNGSLRKIRLSRNGADPVSIDLYDFLLGGDRSGDLRLQDGDTIFIPLIGPVAGVAGNVKRPAIYEMAEPMTLGQVLDLAGGVTFAGWLQRVQVERIEDHRRRIVADFNLDDSDGSGQSRSLETVIADGDVVKVFPVAPGEHDIIQLAGHVTRPGKYEWKPGMRLRDILPSYEVLLPQPNIDYAEIERLVPPDLHPSFIPFDLGKLLAGDETENLELAQYDTIRIFRWDERDFQTVRVSGLVFDPNQYRLVPDMRVSDLIDAAGGLKKNAYIRAAEITRRHISQSGMDTEKIEVDLEKALAGDSEENLRLRDYDTLVVRPIPELDFGRSAVVSGEVRFPGTYPIRRQETLSSLIERAGGYTEQAYLRGAVFTRESARDVQGRRLNQMIQQVEESVLAGTEASLSGSLDAETVKSQQASLEAKQELLAKLREVEITGRVVINLAPLEEFRRSHYDIELEDGDELAIPQRPGVVHVVGEVFNETSLLYESDGTVGYYLRRVGGMTKEADKKQVSVIKADGSVISRQQGKAKLVFWDSDNNGWIFGGFMNTELEPGDTIVVPRKLDRYLWLKTTKDITQIVFQIAVAAGVVFAI